MLGRRLIIVPRCLLPVGLTLFLARAALDASWFRD